MKLSISKSKFSLFILIVLSVIPILSPGEHAATPVDMIVVLALLVLYLLITKAKLRTNIVLVYMMLWIESIVCSVLSPYVSLRSTVFSYLICVIITIGSSELILERDDLEKFESFYIMVALLCAILIILSWLFRRQYTWQRYSIDIIGLHKNPNYINDIILLGLAFTLSKIINTKISLKYILFVSIMAFGLFLTATRAAFLCVLLLIGYLGIVLLIKTRNKTRNLFIFIIGLIVAIYFVNRYLPSKILYRLTGDDALDDSFRTFIWSESFKEFLKQPLLGMGMNATTAYASQFNFTVSNIHNVLLQFLCEQGVFGAILFIIIHFRIIKKTSRDNRTKMILMYIALYFPILFQNGLVGYTFWWPLIILEVYTSTYERMES